MAKSTTPTIYTYRELTDKLAVLKGRLAVWEYLYAHLNKDFLAMDGRPPKKHLTIDDAVDGVPEALIETVIEHIGTGPIDDLRTRIATLEAQVITVVDGTAQAS